MWNLVMGALVSSEDEREQDINNPKPNFQSSSQDINDMKVLSSGSVQRPSQDTPMVHSSREPSPGWILKKTLNILFLVII